jgi:hypothetical protein
METGPHLYAPFREASPRALDRAARTAGGDTAAHTADPATPERLALGAPSRDHPHRIRIFPSLGSFGSLPAKVFPGWSPATSKGDGKCGLAQSTLLSVAGLDLTLLRALRDSALATDAGKQCVALYYKHGAEAATIVDKQPSLARAIVATTRDLEAALQAGASPPDSVRARIETLLTELATHASTDLQHDIATVLDMRLLTTARAELA